MRWSEGGALVSCFFHLASKAYGRVGRPEARRRQESGGELREKGAQAQGTLWLLPTEQPVLSHRNLTFNLVAEGRPELSRL